MVVAITDREGNLFGVYGDSDHQNLARLLRESGWQPFRPGDNVVRFTRETEAYGTLTAAIVHLRPIRDLEENLGIPSTPPFPHGSVSVLH